MRMCRKGNKAMVELQKEELVFDIKNTAYIFADSYIGSDISEKQLKNAFDIGEEGNRDKLARILDSAVEDCREMLFRFTKMEMMGGGFESDEWEECIGSPTNDEDAYYLAMVIPDGFARTSLHAIAVYLHDYIVNECMYEWMMLILPEAADRFWAIAEEKKKKLKEASNRTTRKTRIVLHPF